MNTEKKTVVIGNGRVVSEGDTVWDSHVPGILKRVTKINWDGQAMGNTGGAVAKELFATHREAVEDRLLCRRKLLAKAKESIGKISDEIADLERMLADEQEAV